MSIERNGYEARRVSIAADIPVIIEGTQFLQLEVPKNYIQTALGNLKHWQILHIAGTRHSTFLA